MSNSAPAAPLQIAHEVLCECHECTRNKRAKIMVEQVLSQIEQLPMDKQQHVLACGLRMRELACFYGPYFKLAIALTSCEIASGDLIMSDTAPCDAVLGKDDQFGADIMLPGAAKKGEYLNRAIIVPGNKTKH